MKRICTLISLTLISSVIHSQGIKGVYFRSSTFLPSQSNAYCSMSITLATDASKNINRSSIKAQLGISAGNTALTLVNTASLSNINLSTYSYSFNIVISTPYPVFYQDTFWVSGINNFSASDKSKLGFFADVVLPDFADIAPEVTNLPFSLSNFTVSGNQVLYNPLCQDADGDSLSYELSRGSFYPLGGVTSGGSYLPNGATINPTTGLFSFLKDSTDAGLYAFTIYITDWRKISGTMRQISVSNLSFAITTNLTLSVKDYSDALHSWAFYPNPTSNYLVVDNPIRLNQNFKYAIYDLQGRKLDEGKINTSEQKNIDVSILPVGLYLINISNGEQTFSSKFVKSSN